MKPLKLIILLFVAFTIKATAQSSWITQISNNESVYGIKLINTLDNGFVTILGKDDTISIGGINGIEANKFRFIKLDENGTIMINKTINIRDSSESYLYDFIELQNGDFIGAAWSKGLNGTTSNFQILFKLNNLGDTLWTKYLTNYTESGNIIELNHSFLVTLGSYASGYVGFIHKFDFDGNLIEVNYNDTILLPLVYCSWPGGYRLGKITDNRFFYISKPWVNNEIKYTLMDTLYQTLNTNYYHRDYGCFSPNYDGVALFDYDTFSNLGLYKLDNNIDSVWSYPIANYAVNMGAGTTQESSGICSTSDGGYTLIGSIRNGFVQNPYLVKVDAFGNKEWEKVYWAVVQSSIDVVQTVDGGFVMFQTEGISPQGAGNLWIVKADANGVITSTPEYTVNEVSEIKIYPNPVQNQLNIQFSQPITAQVIIHNQLGQKVQQHELKNVSEYIFETTKLTTGIYFISVVSINQIINQKFIKN